MDTNINKCFSIFCFNQTFKPSNESVAYEPSRILCHNLDKENFPPLLKKLYSSGKASTRLHAIDGFENTGFYPLNNNNIDKSNTKDSSGHKLVMQYDSILVTYDGFSRATWATW
jgi:hypothetical protein